jgi:hypothetical protein
MAKQGTKRKPMTRDQWRQFAADLKQAQDLLLSLHERLAAAAGNTAAQPLRKTLHKLQTARVRIDGLAARQAGESAAGFFMGSGWVYMA